MSKGVIEDCQGDIYPQIPPALTLTFIIKSLPRYSSVPEETILTIIVPSLQAYIRMISFLQIFDFFPKRISFEIEFIFSGLYLNNFFEPILQTPRATTAKRGNLSKFAPVWP